MPIDNDNDNDDGDGDGTECIYDVSHFLWRSGAFAANKKRT